MGADECGKSAHEYDILELQKFSAHMGRQRCAGSHIHGTLGGFSPVYSRARERALQFLSSRLGAKVARKHFRMASATHTHIG